ncbi:MAG: hypothetical protein ABI232_10740 [Jatrophihabitantaceae bacterium]
MRWDALFADLDSQALALENAERAGEVDERIRAELGATTVIDRLRACVGAQLRVQCDGDATLRGALTRVGPDWLLLDEGSGREALIAAHAILTVSGLTRFSAVPDSMDVVQSRLGLWFVLRRIARDRSPVRLLLRGGAQVGATVDRVGSDFVEVAIHATGEPRRRSAVREVRLVPSSALVAVRREV